LTIMFGLICNLCYSQTAGTIIDKRNIYNDKGNYYFDRNEFRKAIAFYNLAYKKDSGDYSSVLKKADAYAKLKLYAQAEECYRIVFESNKKLDNAYRLKYAFLLLANNKPEEFKKWLAIYSQVVEDDIKGENSLVSKENRSKLYKDTTIVLISAARDANGIQSYKEKMLNASAGTEGNSELSISGFNYQIGHPTFNRLKTEMFFNSDAQGGKGGMDLYRSRLINNKWSLPENMGDVVNSKGNETYPFLFNDSILYFTSEGHTGFGKSDVYSINIKDSAKTLINLGNQINTAFNDYAMFLNPDGHSGYLSSDRSVVSASPSLSGPSAGQDNIYQFDILNFKIKYAGYQPRRKTSAEDVKLNLLVSTGEEYDISPTAKDNFEFSFQPMENYKLIIQRENIKMEDIIDNGELTNLQKKELILNPPPVQKAEIKLQSGMKYLFVAGQNPIDPLFIKSLQDKASVYQKLNGNAIDLSVLAREMQFSEEEVYTVRFVKDDNQVNASKSMEVSSLSMNDKLIRIYGQSIFIVLPVKSTTNFNVRTDIEAMSQSFSPQKYALIVDQGSVFKKEEAANSWLIPLTVNTRSVKDVKTSNRFSAKEISIIPGTEYLLTLNKPDPETGKDIEVIVPLTKGVKYNISPSQKNNSEYRKEMAEFILGREGLELASEEVIDLSVLSKELEVHPGENISFTLLSINKPGKKPPVSDEIKTSLSLDGVVYEITRNEKFTINMPFDLSQKVSFQTDLGYVKENFKPDSYLTRIDTTSYSTDIALDTAVIRKHKDPGWLVSMSVNTDSIAEVERQNQFTSREVSIIAGKEYILTVTKVDSKTGKEDEIIVPLTRHVKYNFTSNPVSEDAYKESLEKFLADRKNVKVTGGEVIDIRLISKDLEIKEGDKVSFSLLPVKNLSKKPVEPVTDKSYLFLDNKVVEFTLMQKYTVNVPLTNDRQINMQTDLKQVQEKFTPASIKVDVDTMSFFSEIKVDTTGYGDRLIKEKDLIKDPVFGVIVVNFDLNEHTLQPDAKKTVQEKVINELKGDNRLYVTIKGYTDALGDADFNLNLSKQRAESVKDFLINNGIGENRIRTFSYGASQILKEGINWKAMDEAELRKYRKVEIVIYMPK
jgi:outer membrane protein OmpA-like peptidoglycan-associated protein